MLVRIPIFNHPGGTMKEHQKGQVAASAAEIYEQFFVPSLFIDWPEQVLAASDIQPGHRVLDVACGTGILARAAKELVGDQNVVGLDINEGMLNVARSKAPEISWRLGAAESLPFEANTYDRVVSQFGLMFFDDPARAIAEMLRVVRPEGKVGIAVWASLDETPGYKVVTKMLHELFGAEVAKSLEAPYSMGDIDGLRMLFSRAGASYIELKTLPGKARFDSVESWIYTDIKGWTLADIINDEEYELLMQEAPKRLSRFVQADGSVEFDAPAHIITVISELK